MRNDRVFSARWIPLSTLLLAVRLFCVPAHLALEHFCGNVAHGAAQQAAAHEHAAPVHTGHGHGPELLQEQKQRHAHEQHGDHDHQPHTAIDHLTELIPLRPHADSGPLWAPMRGLAASRAPQAAARLLARPDRAPPGSPEPGRLRARAPPAR